MNILDIHTHRTPAPPTAILSVMPTAFDSASATYFSVGIHPWHLQQTEQQHWAELEKLIRQPNVLAIGETGIDKTIALPMAQQEEAFRQHIQLAKSVGKPVIVHCVRAFDQLIRIRHEAHTDTPFIIHGFRGNPTLCRQLLSKGFYLSFGAFYHEQTLSDMPANRLFLETDESQTDIDTLYERAALLRHSTVEELKEQVQANMRQVF